MSESKKVKRFMVVGGATAGLYYSILLVGVEIMGLGVVATSSLAYVLSLVFNYLSHYRWSFESRKPHRTAVLRYLLTNLIGFTINWVMMLSAQGEDTFQYLFIQTLAIVIIVIWNYIASSRWIFTYSGKI